jgi:hypothetical protein
VASEKIQSCLPIVQIYFWKPKDRRVLKNILLQSLKSKI